MKSRLASVLVSFLLLAVFGFGAFLLVAAEEMPAPGLIVMTISGGMLMYRWFGRGAKRSATSYCVESAFVGSEQARESYDYDMERRRRGEFDMDVHRNGH